MKAIKSVALGRHEIVTDVPRPSAKGHAGFVLVKTKYVGINHCDHLFVDTDFMFQENATIGSECCGEVVEVADEGGCERFKVGDTIAGCVFISCIEVLPDAGCLAEYALVKGDAHFSVDAMAGAISPAQAAGLGISFSTAFYGLYHLLKLPWPGRSQLASPSDTCTGKPILIYGGATNTGMIAIQLARLSGLKVLTTCSPSNFELMRSLGAEHVFDYHDEDGSIEQIRAAAGGQLKLTLNCFGAGDSQRFCGEALSDGGACASVAPWELPQKDKNLTSLFVQGQKVLGEPFKFMGRVFPAEPEVFSEWKRFIPVCEGLIRQGKLKLSPTTVIGNLQDVKGALDSLRKWDNHATKLVCAME